MTMREVLARQASRQEYLVRAPSLTQRKRSFHAHPSAADDAELEERLLSQQGPCCGIQGARRYFVFFSQQSRQLEDPGTSSPRPPLDRT